MPRERASVSQTCWGRHPGTDILGRTRGAAEMAHDPPIIPHGNAVFVIAGLLGRRISRSVMSVDGSVIMRRLHLGEHGAHGGVDGLHAL